MMTTTPTKRFGNPSINADSLSAVLKAANINVADNLVRAFGKVLSGRNVSEYFVLSFFGFPFYIKGIVAPPAQP